MIHDATVSSLDVQRAMAAANVVFSFLFFKGRINFVFVQNATSTSIVLDSNFTNIHGPNKLFATKKKFKLTPNKNAIKIKAVTT